MKNDNETLTRIEDLLEKIERKLEKPKKNNNIPVIVALIGLFGTIFGYLINQNTQIAQLEKQAEYDFLIRAFENGKTGREKRSNIEFFSNFNLIPENKTKIENGLKNSVVSPEGELIFLNSIYEAYNLYELAFELSNENRYQATIKVIKRSIELDSTYFSSFTLLGYAHLQVNEYEEAIKAYSKGLKLPEKDKYLAFYNRGFCYEKLGKIEQSCNDYKEALKYAIENQNQNGINNTRTRISNSCKE